MTLILQCVTHAGSNPAVSTYLTERVKGITPNNLSSTPLWCRGKLNQQRCKLNAKGWPVNSISN